MEKVGAAIERATNAIDALNKKTEQKRKNLLEHVGDAGKSILKRIENIGDRFNDIPLKYKLPVGLAIAALGATGFPFVMPTLALATMYRAASGAGTYALLHHLLEKKYKDIESRGEKVSFLRKGTMEAGALAVAAFGSYYLSQFIGNIWGGLFDGGHGLVNPAQAPTPNIPVVVAPDITPVAIPTPDITPPVLPVEQITPVIVPPSIHTVLPNERLWDIVKNHLLESDTFKNLSLEAKNLEISKYIAYADQHKIVPNVHLIHTGDIIDFSKIDGKIPADILKHVKPFSH